MSKSVSCSARRAIGVIAVVLALALVAGGCGDDDAAAPEAEPDSGTVADAPDEGSEPESDDSGEGSEPDSGGSGQAITVIAEDIAFPEDEYRADAGEVTFVYENQGSILHTLVIEGVDGFELAVSSAGDVDEGTVELEAGEYVMFCDVPGHRIAGMEAALVVS